MGADPKLEQDEWICCRGGNCASLCWGNGLRADPVPGDQMVAYDFGFFSPHLKFLRLARGKGREGWCGAAGWWVVMWQGEEPGAFSSVCGVWHRMKQHCRLTKVSPGCEYIPAIGWKLFHVLFHWIQQKIWLTYCRYGSSPSLLLIPAVPLLIGALRGVLTNMWVQQLSCTLLHSTHTSHMEAVSKLPLYFTPFLFFKSFFAQVEMLKSSNSTKCNG